MQDYFDKCIQQISAHYKAMLISKLAMYSDAVSTFDLPGNEKQIKIHSGQCI